MDSTKLIIFYAIGIAGGLLLAVAPFLRRTVASSTRHHRIALLFTGFMCIAWGVLGLILATQYSHLTQFTYFRIHNVKSLCAGAAIGLLLLQFFTGEFISAYKRDKVLQRKKRQAKAN